MEINILQNGGATSPRLHVRQKWIGLCKVTK